MGSVDPGFGTNLLARHVGQKKAKEIWFLCRQYSAQESMEMGLVNAVVPDAQLDAEVRRWCDEILQMSPTAIALGKRAFNAETESIRGLSNLGNIAVRLYYDSPEGREGERAFRAKRKPQFRKAAAKKKR